MVAVLCLSDLIHAYIRTCLTTNMEATPIKPMAVVYSIQAMTRVGLVATRRL